MPVIIVLAIVVPAIIVPTIVVPALHCALAIVSSSQKLSRNSKSGGRNRR
jgi:hypothetical protein